MLFVATLTHSPERCWAREENERKAEEWIEGMESKADQSGVELHGAYVTPNEHTFYFVLAADEFGAVSEFLGPPLLHDHDAHIAPVLSFEQAADAVLEEGR
jgi:hypothetical protein